MPEVSPSSLAAAVGRRYRALRNLVQRPRPPVGGVDLGDLARDRPISAKFGYDRGTPIDRYYIERFLAANASAIRGRVLEVGDASYCTRFGSGITRQDVLNRSLEDPGATLAGDLGEPDTLPPDSFDCLVITQTLQLVYDTRAAMQQLWQSLRPGGVLLLTVPGVTAVDPSGWDGTWYWSFTRDSASRIFGEAFGAENVEVSVEGNVFATVAFAEGLAVEEIDRALLQRHDPAYQFLICVRARRGA